MALTLTLADLAQRLGAGVLRVPEGADVAEQVLGLQVFDPLHRPPPPRGDVVLGVGVPAHGAAALANELQAAGAAGLLVKAAPGELDGAAGRLLVVNPVVDWARLVTLVQAALDPPDQGLSLFSLCDATAARCGGAVVLHDARFRLLAYSSGQDLSDPVRRDTILGRSAPSEVVARLAAAGVVERLTAGEVVDLDEGGPLLGAPRRIGIGVRTEAELLGSFWVQVPAGQGLDETALRECAESAAVVLVRRRQSGADSGRAADDLLRHVLASGGEGAGELAVQLEADDDCVSALVGVHVPAGGELQRSVVAERFAGLVRGFAQAYRFQMCTALVDQTLYALRVVRPQEPEEQVGRVISQLHEQLANLSVGRVVVSLGPTVPLSEVAQTRRDVDLLLQLLLDGSVAGDVGRTSDCRVALELAELRTLLTAERRLADGPVQRLIAHDEPRGGQLVATLRAWFDSGGDATVVAARLTLHANTVRYRIRRIQEIAGLDLSDPHERFLAELQLRLRAP